ncbi:MAG: hypothetical protein GQ532_16935 [Methylomarinum sp.]|nr:hypothetical protein [Methylomarinum sp.]
METLRKAAEIEADNVRYQYVYAVAVAEKQPRKAIKILESTLKKHTGNMDVLMALVSYNKQLGDKANVLKYSQQAEQVMKAIPN